MVEEEKKAPPAAAEEGKKEEDSGKAEKPAEDVKKEEKKEEAVAAAVAAPPPPPPEIVLRVFMHCEACARKVRRCLNGFEGVEEVITDCRASKVIVKGEKADPAKVLQRVQKKSHRQVELISPIPKPPPPPEDLPEKPPAKPEEKKEEPQVISVVMRVYMHCEACAQEIKRRIQRMKGVESVEPDLKNSEVMIKGVFEPEKLCDYVYKRTGKHATIIKVEPEKKEGEKEKGEESKEEKKAPEEGEKDTDAKKGGEKESKEGDTGGGGGGGSGDGEPPAKAAAPPAAAGESDDLMLLEMRKNELYNQNFQFYPHRVVQEINTYPPQMFSDENPNACAVM